MSDSLLQPGETLGAVVTQPQQSTQQPDPNAGLLRAGESFGPTVQAAATPPAAPEQPGFLNRMWNTSMIGQGAEAGKSIYQHRADELHAALGYMANGDINNAVKTAVKLIPFVDPKSPEMDIIKSITTQPLDNYKKAMAEERKGNVAGMNKYLAETVLPPFSSNIEAGAEDIKNKNYSGLAGDVAGAGINAALLRSGLKEKVPGEKPSLASKVYDKANAATTASAGPSTSQTIGDAFDAATKTIKAAPYAAGQAVGKGIYDFGAGVVDSVSSKIADTLKRSAEEPAATPEQSLGSLQNLRSEVRDTLSNANLPKEAIDEIVGRVEDEYASSHSVSGAAPTSYEEFTKNLSDLTNEIIQNAKDKGLRSNTATGAIGGAGIGAVVDASMGGTGLGAPTAIGAAGGAAVGAGATLSKAAYDILTSRVIRKVNGVTEIGHQGDIMGSLVDRGLSAADAKAAISDFYSDTIGNRIKAITQSVADKFNQYPNASAAAGAAWKFGTGVLDSVSDKISAAMSKAREAIHNATGPTQATGTISDLRANVREALSDTKLPPETIDSIVDQVADKHFIETHPVSGGAPGPFDDVGNWIHKTVQSAADTAVLSYDKVAVKAGDIYYNTPVQDTAVAQAADEFPEVGKKATLGQMTGRVPLAIENWLRKSPSAGEFLKNNYDAEQKVMANNVAQKAVDEISGKHMSLKNAGSNIQDALRSVGEQTTQAFLKTLSDTLSQGDIAAPVSRDFVNTLLPIAPKLADQMPMVAPMIRESFNKVLNTPQQATLADAINVRSGLQAAWLHGTLDQLQMRVATQLLDKDITTGLRAVDPAAANKYAAVANRTRSFIETTYSEVYKQAMKADPDKVFDRMLDVGKNEFLSIQRAIGPTKLDVIHQGIAQQILERSIEDAGLNMNLLKRLTTDNKGKLGTSYDRLNTLHTGLAEMERQWAISGGSAGTHGYYGSSLAKGVFMVGGALVGGGSVVGAVMGLFAEMGLEVAAGQAMKLTAKWLMQPGVMENLSAGMRVYANATHAVPPKEVVGFVNTTAGELYKIAQKEAYKGVRYIKNAVTSSSSSSPATTPVVTSSAPQPQSLGAAAAKKDAGYSLGEPLYYPKGVRNPGEVEHRILDSSGKEVGRVNAIIHKDGTAEIIWLGSEGDARISTRREALMEAHAAEAEEKGPEWVKEQLSNLPRRYNLGSASDTLSGKLGPRDVVRLKQQFLEDHPEVKTIEGLRIAGARANEGFRKVEVPTTKPPKDKGPISENKSPFSFKQYLASNAHQYDNPQELQAAAQEAGKQAELAGHPVIG